MKEIVQKIWIAIVLLCLSPSVYAYDFMLDGLAYKITSVENLTCGVVSGDEKYAGNIIIPSSVEYMNRTLAVTSIESGCFENNENLLSVSIPESVKSLGSCFSGCSSLSSVNLPRFLTSLPNRCFSGCSSLATINLPETLISMGDFCFQGCSSLTSINLPESLTFLGFECFGFSGLKEIYIPNGCNIGKSCFYQCKDLSVADINGNIGYNAFEGTALSVLEIGECCKSLEQASISFDRYVETDPNVEYEYTRYQVYYDDFTIPTSLKFLNIVDSSDSLEVEIDATFISTVNNYQLVYGSVFTDSEKELIKSWGDSIEELYLGRDIVQKQYNDKAGRSTRIKSQLLKVPHLKQLTVGPLITSIPFYINGLEELKVIKTLNTIPPAINGVTESQFAHLLVEVPEEALEAYKSDSVWGKFWNLQVLGVENIEAEAASKFVTGRYDLNGRAVSEDYQGLVIVRFSDGSCKKMLNR